MEAPKSIDLANIVQDKSKKQTHAAVPQVQRDNDADFVDDEDVPPLI
jgi:hypothetical protein